MMNKTCGKTALICFVLALCMILGTFAGCGNAVKEETTPSEKTSASDTKQTEEEQTIIPDAQVKSADLMEGIALEGINLRRELKWDYIRTSVAPKLTDFAVRLFKQTNKNGESTLVSPLSVMLALAMTANGAEGNTLSQMESVFGMDIGTLNKALAQYRESLPQGDKYVLDIANAIWFKDDPDFAVKKDFLQKNAAWYNAGLYSAPFNDQTLEEVNAWVKIKTRGMIENILDRMPDDAVMYLVNALAFQAEWEETYSQYNVHESEFTLEDGTKKTTEFMYSEEDKYLYDEKATGFVKYFKDRKYAFASLLPDEGVKLCDYVDSLTGEKVYELLASAQDAKVNAAIPKFKSGSTINLNDVLKAMGMSDAFDAGLADLSGIGTHGDGNLYIGRVLHKTFIEVSEQGAKAGAATVAELLCGSAYDPEPPKVVILDRPFVYMLIDCETNTPFFIGTLADID